MIIPQLYNSILTLSATLPARLDALVGWLSGQYFADNEMIRNFLIEAYDTLSESVGKWVNDTMMPYMQDLVSGVGQSVWNAIIGVKNLLIGLFVAVYLLASRRRFAHQAKILLPAAAPSIVNGLRIGLGVAWMCLVSAEMLPGSLSGVGYLITHAYTVGRTDVVIAGMISISVVGALLDMAFQWIERRKYAWKQFSR